MTEQRRKIKFSGIVAAVVVWTSAVFAAPQADWVCYAVRNGGGVYSVDSQSAEACVLHAKRVNDCSDGCWALAIVNVNRRMWTQNKLAFTVRSLTGRPVKVSATVSYESGKKTVMKGARPFTVAGRNAYPVVLGLDTDFGLGDTGLLFRQIKIGVDITDWKPGESGGIELKQVRLCAPGEVSFVSGPGDVVVTSVPARPRLAAPIRKDALRIYFCFDNEDVIPSVHTGKPGLEDAQSFAGYRAMLLEPLKGAAVAADDPETADLIVYSVCRPDAATARRIVEAVTVRGVPLLALAEVADPEIAAILPCEQTAASDAEDFPKRFRLAFPDASHPLVRGGGFSTASFGRYRMIRPKEGATTVLAFADGGGPVLVEGRAGRGRVVYNTLGVGVGVVPGRRSPDAFLVRVAGWLTGRTLPEAAAPAAAPDADGWRKGAGRDGFGRFGWEIGSGLLVDDLGHHLTVTHGPHAYGFEFPRGDTESTNRLRRFDFSEDRINSLGMGGEIRAGGRTLGRLDVSLACPGIRWDFYGSSVKMTLRNLLGFAAVPHSGGVRTVSLSHTETIPSGGTEPWLLLFNGLTDDHPLLLVFQRRPASVHVRTVEGAPYGLDFSVSSGPLGMIVPLWIFGNAPCDTSHWSEELPKDVLNRIALWYPRAGCFPVSCEDRFRIDAMARRIEIKSVFTYRETSDEWGTVHRPYAPVSPVAFLLKNVRGTDGVRFFIGEEGLSDRDLATRFGPFADKDGSNAVVWSLPLPEPDLSLLPHTLGFPRADATANAQFAKGVTFSCGGGVKLEARNKAWPEGRERPRVFNLNLHGSLLGLGRCLPNPFIYSPENQRLLRRRIRLRLLEPLETHQYKMVTRWRREPASGIPYTVYMNSPRDILTRYRPETYGSKIIYGDSNETVRMILVILQKLADQHGQSELVRAHWDTIKRDVVSYLYALDDWGFLASGCLEYGGPGCIDMLNSEYGCFCSLARLAEIAGDESVRAQALYRAARRACPTLARLHMKEYCVKNGLLRNQDVFGLSTGYNESGAVFRRRGARVRDVELFDMSQGIPQDLVTLYRRHGLKELQAGYLNDVQAADAAHGRNYIMTAILALAGEVSDADLARTLESCLDDNALNARLVRDWPGMDTGSYIEYTLHRLADSPEIVDCRDLTLHAAVYDPSSKTLKLDYTPGPEARLIVRAGPEAAGSGRVQDTNGRASLPVPSGKRTVIEWHSPRPAPKNLFAPFPANL